MELRRLGRTGLHISPVIFGGIICMNETPETAAHYVDFAVDAVDLLAHRGQVTLAGFCGGLCTGLFSHGLTLTLGAAGNHT